MRFRCCKNLSRWLEELHFCLHACDQDWRMDGADLWTYPWRSECGLQSLRSGRTHDLRCNPETLQTSWVVGLEPTGWQERCLQCTGLQLSGLRSRNHLQGTLWTCLSCLRTVWQHLGSILSSPQPPLPSSTSRQRSFLWPEHFPLCQTSWGSPVLPEAYPCASPAFCHLRPKGKGLLF